MTMLTDIDRKKLNLLVGAMHAQTEMGKITWDRHRSGPPDEYIWEGTAGYVIIGVSQIEIRKRFGDPPAIREKDFPGVDHLWSLVHDSWEERANATIEAILADLDKLPFSPPVPKVILPPAELIPTESRDSGKPPTWDTVRAAWKGTDWQLIALKAIVVAALVILILALGQEWV